MARVGVNEAAVRATLRELGVNPRTDARARLAVTLAGTLDDGAGMATAAVARELRATLCDLEELHTGHDDEFSRIIEGLQSPLGD